MSDSDKTSLAGQDTPLWQLLDSPTVDVYVGSEKTRWPLPERLLSHHSNVLASTFEDSNEGKPGSESKSARKNRKSYTLPDEENATFEFLVEYLYSSKIPTPSSEKFIGPLLDLYLLAQKLEMNNLAFVVVDSVREHYHSSNTYPGLRRVQYIYSNTDEDNEMREMMVSAVARQLTVGEKIPAHWAAALQRNGQLAVDIIRAIQQWHIEERSIPDARDASEGRGRKAKGGFSAVDREGDSVETDNSMLADSAIGLESRDGDREDSKYRSEGKKPDVESNLTGLREVAAEAHSIPSSSPLSSSPSSSSSPPTSPLLKVSSARPRRPPSQLHSEQRKRRRRRNASLSEEHEPRVRPSTIAEADEDPEEHPTLIEKAKAAVGRMIERKELAFLVLLWVAYLIAIVSQVYQIR